MSTQLLSTPATHSSSLVSFADRAWSAATEAAFKIGSSKWLTSLAESVVISTLKNVSQGQLTIHMPEQTYVFPDPSASSKGNHSPDVRAIIRVLKPTFWLRICLTSDMGFAEAFMFGDIECDDLVNVFEIFILNRAALASMSNTLSSVIGTISAKITSSRFLGSLANTRSNISSHYDLSNEMYMGFLSKDMTYSSAIFEDLDGDLSGAHSGPKETDPLYEGQMRKYDHLIRKADIRPGHRVLEIGSGWGAFAIRIAQSIPGTTVDTITLSSRQLELAVERIKEAGLEDRINIHLMDYRSMPAEWEGAFDRAVSVEMMEHVGYDFLEVYWKQTHWALKSGTGAGVIQCITLPEARYDNYIREIDFMRKWIFPGGHIPTLTHLVTSLRDGSKGALVVESVNNIGPHYARTLRTWRQRFEESFDRVIVPALKAEYPDTMDGPAGEEEIQVFKRRWIYYYSYCEIGFTTRALGDHIISFTREGNREFGCQVYN